MYTMLGTLTHKENVWNPNKKDLQSEKLPRNVYVSYFICNFKYFAGGCFVTIT